MAKGGAPKAGWYRDPSGRHELRRWDGDGWSEWVIDGGRRDFDDLDGCGGPPQGALVSAIDGGKARHRFGRGRRRGPTPTGGSSTAPVLVGGRDTRRGLTIGLAATAAAMAAGWAVVELVPVFAGPSLVRAISLRFTLAALAFEAVLAAGLVIAARGHAPNPLRPPTRFTSEELLRGGIGFLLALFASSFVSQAARTLSWSSLDVDVDALVVLEAFVLVVVAPIVEERMFRGLLLAGLRDRFGPVIGVIGAAAIGGAAITWTGIAGSSTGVALMAAAAGCVYGWFAHTTDDLKPPMLAHAFLALWVLVGRF